MYRLFTILFACLFVLCFGAMGQTRQMVDSIAVSDTLQRHDTLATQIPTANRQIELLRENKQLNMDAAAVSYPQKKRTSKKPEPLFYYLVAITFLLALGRVLFEKYFNNLFRLFFNLTLRQNQIREQLMQERLPAIIFNLVFVLVYGLVLYFLIAKFAGLNMRFDWRILLACTAAIIIIYAFKYAVISVSGWLTGFRQEMKSYRFVVFLINKVSAIYLLPLVFLMAFGQTTIGQVAAVLCIVAIGFSFLFRYLKGYGIFGSNIRVSALQFVLSLVMLDVLPLAIIYKFATSFFNSYL